MKQKLTKRDIFAHVWIFINYIEDVAAMPKGLCKNIHAPTVKAKCMQLKKILEDNE